MTGSTTPRESAPDADRVTVVIPVFNGAEHLVECVESVLAQHSPVHEVIIANDGSTDATPTLADELARRDPRVRNLRLPHHGRPGPARNLGAAAGTGEWLAFLDADDVWLPHKLDVQLAALRSDPSLIAVGGIARYLGRRGPMRGVFGRTPDEATWAEVRAGRAMPFHVSSTIVVRRTAFDTIGGFDERLPAAEDFALIARLAAIGPVGCVADEVAYYRLRGRSISADHHARSILTSSFVAARIAAQAEGRHLEFDEFRSAYRLSWRQRRQLRGSRCFRNIAVDLAEQRWGAALVDAVGAVALTPVRTVRRLGEKFSARTSR